MVFIRTCTWDVRNKIKSWDIKIQLANRSSCEIGFFFSINYTSCQTKDFNYLLKTKTSH